MSTKNIHLYLLYFGDFPFLDLVTFGVQTFPLDFTIKINRRTEFVYRYRERISIYYPLSYPLRSMHYTSLFPETKVLEKMQSHKRDKCLSEKKRYINIPSCYMIIKCLNSTVIGCFKLNLKLAKCVDNKFMIWATQKNSWNNKGQWKNQVIEFLTMRYIYWSIFSRIFYFLYKRLQN